MIRTLAMACALACVALPAMAQQQMAAPPHELCGIFQITSPETVEYSPLPGYSVLTATPPFRAPPGSVHAMVCDRTSIFIGPVDYRVITDLGVPLFIRSSGRIAILEIADRQLRLRFTRGQPTPSEQAAISEAIERALVEMDRMPAPEPQAPTQ
ncbi:MAG: hypothetical protein AB7G40_00105 [Hyphomonadaceae bacterium]